MFSEVEVRFGRDHRRPCRRFRRACGTAGRISRRPRRGEVRAPGARASSAPRRWPRLVGRGSRTTPEMSPIFVATVQSGGLHSRTRPRARRQAGFLLATVERVKAGPRACRLSRFSSVVTQTTRRGSRRGLGVVKHHQPAPAASRESGEQLGAGRLLVPRGERRDGLLPRGRVRGRMAARSELRPSSRT